ncbi:MAG: UDP-N-acetylmuramoyl-tripeptide--D-alanyl-D-alanine ligase [Ignavibacteria bacterium]
MNRPKIKLEDLFELESAVIYNPDIFTSSSNISTDTRTIKKNSIFVALKGEKFDGHLFVIEAVKKGATAIVINKNRLKDFDAIDVTIVTVKDTTKAYGDIASIWRNKLNAQVIGITGSNGKTSTKEILSTILSEKYSVVKTSSNNNNHIGVPLTILEAGNDTEVLVLELGTNHFGEIDYSSKIARPDFSVITNIGESHLEYFIDIKGVAKEKIALFEETAKYNGQVFINNDDAILRKKARSFSNKVTYGFTGKPDIKGKIIEVKDGKSTLSIKFREKEFNVSLPVFGLSNAKNFLAAASIALGMGLSPESVKRGATKLVSVDRRLDVKFKNGMVLINDCYNANPLSMNSAFEFVKSFPNHKRKIAILGDMFELGKTSVQAHKELSLTIKKNGITDVYTTGKLMKHLVSELNNSKIIVEHFNKREKLSEFLIKSDFSEAVVLVKGSRGMKMDEFVKIIDKEN